MAQTNQPVANSDPGQGWGIASLVTSLLGIGLAGVICGFIGNSKSKAVGKKNVMAIIGIVLGFLQMAAAIVGIILLASGGMIFGGLISKCAELGPGTHYVNGVTYTCGSIDE